LKAYVDTQVNNLHGSLVGDGYNC